MIHALILFFSLLIGHEALAQDPSVRLWDEGVDQGIVSTLNCTGSGVACSKSEISGRRVGTINVTGGGGGGSGAPTDAVYWTGAANGSLSSEVNLGALNSGLVINTNGAPTAYLGTTCVNQVIRMLNVNGNATCQTITSAFVDTTVWTGTVSSGLLKAASQGVLEQAVAGTDYVTPAGNVATATALAANGGNCSGNNFALGVDASGVGECAQPAFSNLSGSLALSQTSMATARLLGRVTASTGVVEELTGTQATTLLDTFTDALKGLAPASGGGTTNFLRADGSWAAPPGGGGASTDATYWVGSANGTLSAEHNLGALSTGLVLNTTGTPSAYAGTSCTNQFPRSLNGSGAATCADVVPADFASQTANFVLAAPNGSAGDPTFRALVDNDIPDTITISLAATATALAADPADCGANNYAISINASGTLGCAQPSFGQITGSVTDGQVPNTITIDLATAATALSADPADCSGNNFALGIIANGTATCAQPAFSNLSGSATDGQIPNTITLDNLTQITTRAISDTTGTLLVGRGGTGQTTITTNQLYVGTALDTLAAKTIPSCSNGTTSKLLFNNSTQEFSCGTDQSGGAGASWTTVEIDFGTRAAWNKVATITDGTVSGSSKIIVVQAGTAATGKQADDNEMEQINCNGTPGTGQFILNCMSQRTVTHGAFKVHYVVN